MDRSLDDITVHAGYRGGRGSRPRGVRGVGPMRHRDRGVRSRPVPYSRETGISHHRDHGRLIEGTKLYLSNLDSGVRGEDIEDMFRRFGRVRQGTVHYDRSGEPLGTGTVTFERRGDAIRAMQQHDNVIMELVLSDPPTHANSRGTGQNRGSFDRRGGRGLRGERRERGEPTTTRRPLTEEEMEAQIVEHNRLGDELVRRRTEEDMEAQIVEHNRLGDELMRRRSRMIRFGGD